MEFESSGLSIPTKLAVQSGAHLQGAASQPSEAGRESEAESLRRRPGMAAAGLASRKFSPLCAADYDYGFQHRALQ